MHTCPSCGQACYCSGDIDDVEVTTEAWAFMHCKCDCESEFTNDEEGLDEEEDWLEFPSDKN